MEGFGKGCGVGLGGNAALSQNFLLMLCLEMVQFCEDFVPKIKISSSLLKSGVGFWEEHVPLPSASPLY